MDSPQHTTNQAAFETVDFFRWTGAEKDQVDRSNTKRTVGFLEGTRDNPHRLPQKKKKTTIFRSKENSLPHDKGKPHKCVVAMANFNELNYELLSSAISSGFGTSDYFLFA